MHRAAQTLLVAMSLGCFDPKLEPGTLCEPDIGCPSSFECVNGVCIDPSNPPPSMVDAASPPPVDAAPGIDARPPCVEGDVRVDHTDGTCYWAVFSTLQDKAASAASCAAGNGELAAITSMEETTVVTTLVSDAYAGSGNTVPDYWIGASDVAIEGTFVWDNGESFIYTNWRQSPLEPNNGQGAFEEDCVAVEADATPPGVWDDRPCAAGAPVPANIGHICERR